MLNVLVFSLAHAPHRHISKSIKVTTVQGFEDIHLSSWTVADKSLCLDYFLELLIDHFAISPTLKL